MALRTALVVALSALPLAAARAGGNPGLADAEPGFGAIDAYPPEEQARASCRQDAVVWADRHAGCLYRAGEKEHGALGSNDWDTSPLSSMAGGHGPGRVFPCTSLPQPAFGS